ncbi:exodeoxyribonuclease VII large subunit [Chryseobacterium sp. A321]
MSVSINNRKVFTLSEVTSSIQKTIQNRYSSEFWVVAEINKLNYYSHSGHCFPELVEKEGSKIKAELRGIIWNRDFEFISSKFLTVLKTPIRDGIKVLLLAKVTFHPISGVQLSILDIDPTYTLGDLEREKNESIEKLKAEGLFATNKERSLSLVPQRIAVISAESSKGYSDFVQILDTNEWGYKFFHMLFPAVLQGEKSVTSILLQLKNLNKVLHHFDAVAIIRGGGGEVGLSSFNNYELSKAIAKFPLPVITGIGHSTNLTVAEMVSYYNAITPTKTAEFLIQKFHEFSVPVSEAQKGMVRYAAQLLKDSKENVYNAGYILKIKTVGAVQQENEHLNSISSQLSQYIRYQFKEGKERVNQNEEKIFRSATSLLSEFKVRLDQMHLDLRNANIRLIENKRNDLSTQEKILKIVDPENTLRRGFSITRYGGKALTDPSAIEIGEQMETILYKGTITSTVIKKQD